MSRDLRSGGIVAAIAVAVLLIGTATGNAYVMLGMSVAALIVLTALHWRRTSGKAMLLALVAAATAATTAGLIAATL